MVRGLFTAWTGLQTEQKRLDVISNNIANSATVGYKSENVTNQSFDNLLTLKVKDASEMFNDHPIGTMSLGVKLGEVYTDYTQGSFRETGNTYDLAIEGNGFFELSVVDKNGEASTKYTRNGTFTMTKDGYIVDTNGNRVQGESGDLQVPVEAGNVIIDVDGSVIADGEIVNKVKLVDFEDYNYLEKFADNLYQPVEGAKEIDSSGKVIQGYTEQSNVNVISEMVEMINITRAYEANQKVMQTIDGSLQQVTSTVGKL